MGQSTVTLADANDAVFDSAGLVTLSAGGSPGTLAAANGLTLDFGGNFTGFGTVDTPNDMTTPLINNGHIAGDSVAEPITFAGYVKGVGTLDNVERHRHVGAGLQPGHGDPWQRGLRCALEIEISGTSLGSFDRLEHVLGAGVANLGGSLVVSLIDGFEPELGDTFEFLTSVGGVNGSFAIESLPILQEGLGWDVIYGANSVALMVTHGFREADFDEDGDVDGDDLTRWRNNFGTGVMHMTGDADADADADGADFLTWQRQFGSIATAASPNAPVPEPTTLVLLMFAIAGWCFRRWRKA